MKRLGPLYRLKHLFKNLYKNKVRFALTVIGLVVPGIILMASYFVLDSIYFSNFNEYSHYEEEAIMQVEVDSSGQRPLAYLTSEFGDKYISFKPLAEGSLTLFRAEGQDIALQYRLVQTSTQFNGGLIFEGDYVMPSDMTEGRSFTNEDVTLDAPVALIDSVTALMLYGGESAVGKILSVPIYGILNSGDYGILGRSILEIVGVFEASAASQVDFLAHYGSGDDFAYQASIYVTTSFTFPGLAEPDDITYVFYDTKDVNRVRINYFNNMVTGATVLDIVYFDAIVADIQSQYQTLKIAFIAAAVVLLLISSASIISIMIFAVKERIAEIGVKKAFGATKVRVMVDFLLEGVMTGAIAFLISLVAALYIAYLGFFIYRTGHPEQYFYNVFIRFDSILLTFLLIHLSTLVATIIPASYAARINISDAIKFE